MTVPSATSKAGPYHGNNVTKVFGFGFKIVDAAHIQVIVRNAQGDESTLVLNTDYTVTGVGVDAGGSITKTTALATGSDLTILRNVPFVQETDLENQGAYYAETVEDAFDLAAMRDQQLKEELDRAVKMPENLDPSGLGDLVADIILLGDSADNIDTVANNIADVNTVVDNISNVNTVANNIGGVNTVATNITDVNTVAAIAGNMNTVAGDHDEIVALAAITANINTVAGIDDDVSAVAGNTADISTVADNILDVTNFADVYQGAKVSDPATRNDGSPLQLGDLYFSSALNAMRVYAPAGWISATGGETVIATKEFTGDGVASEFDLNVAPASAANVLVLLGGVVQRPLVDYTVSGKTLTFVVAPFNGADVFTWVIISATQLAEITPSFSTITEAASATISDEATYITIAGQRYGRIDNSYPGLGGNIVVNGDMSSATGWTLETGWAISGGVLSKTGAAVTVAKQTGPVVAGTDYLIEYDLVSYTSGGVRIYPGNGAATNVEASVGHKSQFITSAGDAVIYVSHGSTPFVGSIDNLSVRALPSGSFENTASGEWWGTTGPNVTGDIVSVGSISAIKAIDTDKIDTAYLTEVGREGLFLWRTGDFSTDVAADTAEGRVIKAANIAATIGAWHRPRERAYLFTDFGMDPTGSTNSSDAFWYMLQYVKKQGGGTLFDRPQGGDYRFDSVVSVTDTDIKIAGSSRELTEFHGNNGVGIFKFEDTGATVNSTYGRARRLEIEGISFVAINGGTLNRGIAIEAVWPHPSSVGATQCCVLADLNWRSQTYNADNTNSGHWGQCVRLANAHASDIINPVIYQINNTAGYGINLDYGMDAAAYSVGVKGIRAHGLHTAIRVRGHAENLQFDIEEMAGNTNGIDLDAAGSTIPGGRNPVVFIRNGHINSKATVIRAVQYNVLNIANCDLYKGVGFGDVVADLIYVNSSKFINITNSKIEVAAGAGASAAVGQFANVEKMRVGNCLFQGGYSGMVFSGTSSEITIDADVRSGQSPAGGTGVYIAPGVNYGSFRGEVVGWTTGISNNASWDISGARYRNNTSNN